MDVCTTPQRPETAVRPFTVVIADDIEEMRDLVRAHLKKRPGVQVVSEVADGRSAVHRCAEMQPDLVILDIAMPVMDGLEAMREIRTSAPGTKVLLHTTWGTWLGRDIVPRLGADDYAVKVDGRKALLAALDRLTQVA